VQLVLAVLWLVLSASYAFADDRAQVHATAETGYGRLILEFTGRTDLPAYKITSDNGVLAITFTSPVSVNLPDMAATLPQYTTVGRVDPDGKGIRFGLTGNVGIHSMEAGEKLFIDMLPSGWQGLPPPLPPEIVADLAARAKAAAKLAAQKLRAEQAKALNPTAQVSVGRNPTFTRVEFDWSTSTKATYKQDGTTATILFDWPVSVDLYNLKADLPAQILSVASTVSPAGNAIVFNLADGVTPRFFGTEGQSFTFDVDLSSKDVTQNQLTAEQAMQKADEQQAAAEAAAAADASSSVDPTAGPASPMASDYAPGQPITPTVDEMSGTVRVKFPFERDTPSAVFRRGNALWMLFDTTTPINQPTQSDALNSIATGVTIQSAGDTQVVRIDLSTAKLATLASEGRSWVLSVGDVLLNASEPVTFKRTRDQDGHFEMTASLGKPYKVHSFRDPVVGDLLDVVTAFPPSRSSTRDLRYVDFDALSSVHGLVIRPDNDAVQVSVVDDHALIQAPDGLSLSDQNGPRTLDAGKASEFRDSFVDFAALKDDDPEVFEKKTQQLSEDAAVKEGQAREVARLALAQYYVGNQFAEEALGVLRVLSTDLKTDEIRKKVKLTTAIADVLAARPSDALTILNSSAFTDEVDAVMWRAIAHADDYDFVDARADALAADPIADAYPVWVQQKFYFAGVRAALETNDVPLAQRYLGLIGFAQLSPEQVSLYQLFQGRIAEATGQTQEALDTYGQVITADVRPTRAEAVYRTLLILKQTGKIDLAKATATLAAEAMMWRGNPLEVDMDKLLTELYFENKDFRLGFETAKDVAEHSPESKPIDQLMNETDQEFADLYLNGAADQMSDLDALSLYYDFRSLTPAGARGDEMIRNLARRLVKVDLLSQAGDLLQYQVDSRLQGVAQAQVATDLALIRIADRNPDGALRAINQTRMSKLSPTLERQRRILEARALIDADREDLALDLLHDVQGHDADLLRVDGYWKSKNYQAGANLIEQMYSADPTAPLKQPDRMDLIKAAVGYVLVGDPTGLDRLRSKFSDRMSHSPEWPMFDYITSPNAAPGGLEFKEAAKAVAGLDTVTAFLKAYRATYPVDQAVAPAEAAKKSDA
jgi:hypothetical protein